jgi:hypothetical protein
VLIERDASAMDLVLDLIGSTIAVVAMRGSGGAGYRLAGAVVAVAVLTLMLPARVLFAYSHRDEIFPSLLDAGNWRQHPLLYSNSKLDVVERRIDSDRFGNALRVCWADHQYPGLHFEETVADWSRYATLVVDLEVLGDAPMRITAAIGHEGIAGTFAYVSESFAPGQSSWRVPLASLIQTREGESARISHFILHSSRQHKQQCVIFAQVRLE